MGKHWAIEIDSTEESIQYLRGDRQVDPSTPYEAEQLWRRLKKLYFISVRVRRTTKEEDRKLSLDTLD